MASPALVKLQTLDLRNHYASKAVIKQLKALPLKVLECPKEIDDEEPGTRYVTVGE